MVNSADFSKRLEKIMEYYEVNAAALAEAIDFNRSTISHLLSGRNKPSLEFVMKVLQKFPEVDMDWLVLGKGQFPTTPSQRKIEPEKVVSKNQKIVENRPLDLFSNISEASPKSETGRDRGKEIERIVIFYTDGTFKRYEN